VIVFLDNCIFSLSDTLETASMSREIRWGDSTQSVDVVGHIRKSLPRANEEWKKEQILCLPTIGKLAKDGVIKLHTYHEVNIEGWKRSASAGIGNALDGVNVISAKSAVERSYFFPADFFTYTRNDKLIEFCKWLISLESENISEKLRTDIKYPKFTLENLSNVQRFRDICIDLPDKHLPDAFHLWTAEVNGAKYFLTTDKKFINKMTKSKSPKFDLLCRPLSPKDLLSELNITVREPMKFPVDEFINFFGEIYPPKQIKTNMWNNFKSIFTSYFLRK
jgi:hypothetical protein